LVETTSDITGEHGDLVVNGWLGWDWADRQNWLLVDGLSDVR